MRPFTDEEFEKMISEMTDACHPSFDTLCAIAEKTLRSKVKYWCATDPALSGRDTENDIMQDIFVRLIKTTVTHFLLRKDSGGQINRDPDGFKNWMFKVAKNIKNDASRALRNMYLKVRGFDDGEEDMFPDSQSDFDEEPPGREEIAQAFQIVLDSDSKIYKVLTWLAQSIFIIEFDITKIRSNDAIISAFGDKTLYEMRDMVLMIAERSKWIVVTPDQVDKIDRALGVGFKGKPIGEIRYKDFFMKKGGKASISDWVNRMNRLIESRMK